MCERKRKKKKKGRFVSHRWQRPEVQRNEKSDKKSGAAKTMQKKRSQTFITPLATSAESNANAREQHE